MLKRISFCFLKRFTTFVLRTKRFGVVHAWSACAGRERLDRPVVRRGREARREGGPGPEPRLDVLVDLAKPESPGAGGEGSGGPFSTPAFATKRSVESRICVGDREWEKGACWKAPNEMYILLHLSNRRSSANARLKKNVSILLQLCNFLLSWNLSISLRLRVRLCASFFLIARSKTFSSH